MGKWFAPLMVAVFALLGVAMTAAHYCVPALKSNQVISFLVPVKAFVDPVFSTPPADIDRLAAETAAPWNAGVYAVVGLFATVAVKVVRKRI
jgi:hypothetical protein